MRIVGVSQSGARHATAERHVLQLAAHRPKASLDIAKALAISQLGERHRQILIAASEASPMSITAIARDALLEFVGGQMVHQLSEDNLAGIHPSLSEMASRPGGTVPGSDCAGKSSNRKNQLHPQPTDAPWVISLSEILAGQPCCPHCTAAHVALRSFLGGSHER